MRSPPSEAFVAAAENLRTTQPALSKRIAEMEMSIGASLFDRSLRTVQLTAKGHAILKLCEEMLNPLADPRSSRRAAALLWRLQAQASLS